MQNSNCIGSMKKMSYQRHWGNQAASRKMRILRKAENAKKIRKQVANLLL